MNSRWMTHSNSQCKTYVDIGANIDVIFEGQT
jgi:hypothetical protein